MPVGESVQRHLVMMSRDDRRDLMTDGFSPLSKLFTRFVVALRKLVQYDVNGIVLLWGTGVKIRYVVLFVLVLLRGFGWQIALNVVDWNFVVEFEVYPFLPSDVEPWHLISSRVFGTWLVVKNEVELECLITVVPELWRDPFWLEKSGECLVDCPYYCLFLHSPEYVYKFIKGKMHRHNSFGKHCQRHFAFCESLWAECDWWHHDSVSDSV